MLRKIAERMLILVFLVALVGIACAGSPPKPVITEEPVKIATAAPTATASPTATSAPTATPVPTPSATPVPTPTLTPTSTATPVPKEPLEILDWRIEQKFPKGVELVVDLRDGGSLPDLRRSRLTLKIKGKTQVVGPKANRKNPTPNQVVFVIDGGNNFIVWTEIDGGTLEIVDKQGNVRTELIGSFTYEDTRFTWETRESENVKVLFYGPEDPVKPEEVLGEVEGLLAKYSITLERPIRVVVYRNKPEMDRAIPFRSKKHQKQMVTLGIAFSDIDVVFVSREGRPINFCVLRHELMHHIIHILAGKAALPAWLSEGLAEYACSENLSLSDQFRIGRALGNGDFMPLSWLEKFSGTPDMFMLSYAESHSFVIFLVETETYGLDKILELLGSVEGLNIGVGDAIEKVYGKSLGDLEAEWVESLTP